MLSNTTLATRVSGFPAAHEKPAVARPLFETGEPLPHRHKSGSRRPDPPSGAIPRPASRSTASPSACRPGHGRNLKGFQTVPPPPVRSPSARNPPKGSNQGSTRRGKSPAVASCQHPRPPDVGAGFIAGSATNQPVPATARGKRVAPPGPAAVPATDPAGNAPGRQVPDSRRGREGPP